MEPLGWIGIARLGLVQAALGSIVVLVTSTLNRVMVIEYALPALVPGALVALHYLVQIMRPLLGYGSDMGGHRTPWIVGGLAALGTGAVAAALSAGLMATNPLLGAALSALAFTVIGLGVGAAGTALLALLAHRVAPARRGAAATIVWLMMIAGIVVAATTAAKLLDPFSPTRLIEVTAAVAATAVLIACAAVWRIEGPATPLTPRPAHQPFLPALREVWAEPQARRFTIFVFVSMLAYSAQELVLEPFGGIVFKLTPGQSAGLTGLQHAGVLAGMALVAVATLLAGDDRGRAMRAWTIGGCITSALLLLALACAGLSGLHGWLQPLVALLGVANGAFAASAIGSMMGLASNGRPAREGTRMGLWGAAQALAFGAGGLAGSGASDAARLLLGDPATAYAAVFATQAALFIAASVLAARVFQPSRSRVAAPAAAIPVG